MNPCGLLLTLGWLIAAEEPPKAAKPLDDVARLQGTWDFTSLEIDGQKMPQQMLTGSKIEIAGNKFTTTTGDAVYRGTFKIDASQKPKTIDMTFTEGPEKGNAALGIYELEGENWKLCLTIANKERPKEFATKPNSGLALETLKPRKEAPLSDAAKAELAKFAGEWLMESGEINGQKMPEQFRTQFKRTVKGDVTLVMMGDQVFMRAKFTVDPAKKPKAIDYLQLEGPTKGVKQFGIYEWDGEMLKLCFASPGQDRPVDFTAPAGSGRTSSVWKRAKKN
jgi:uncharacterized protein (TIGR03067 family)